MLTNERIYREGFLDAMRQCGSLAVDVPDGDIKLSHDWRNTIQRCYAARHYDLEYHESGAKLHQFMTKLITDEAKVWDENRELRKLLKLTK